MANECLVTVPSEILINLIDPLNDDPWQVGGVHPSEVTEALKSGRLRNNNPCWDNHYWTSQDHAERIAWLIHHGWDSREPLCCDINYFGGVNLWDGNHRLYALALTKISCSVTVEVSGYLDVAEDLLGVKIPD